MRILNWTLFVFGLNFAHSFNVDVNSKVIHEAPRRHCDGGECMFGFAVAQHREQGQPWLLVGAPEADSGQPGVVKGGAVFKCPPEAPGSCDLIQFDTKGNTLAPTGQQYDKKSGQWFGSLVQSSGENGVVLACAPRYVYYIFMNRMDPVGMCFSAKNNFRQIRAHRPCVESAFYGNLESSAAADSVTKSFDQQAAGGVNASTIGNRTDYVKLSNEMTGAEAYMICDFTHWEKLAQTSKRDHCDIFQRSKEEGTVLIGKWGYHRQGSCQAGLGAAIAEDGNQVYVGAVGSWYWQGQVFSQKLLSLRDQHKTSEGSPSDDDSYLGYSVATGEFNGDNDNADVVVGMPRGANLTGKVVLYNANLTNLNNMTGDQIGAYFGYAVASGDLNGDGLDDVIVGAPMWTNYEVMGKYETGRVYVVYQDQNHAFKKFDTLEGKNNKARFGLAVACAGNINLDGRTQETPKGIQDLVVGAPYDGPEHRGAIYIYLGTPEGISKNYAQVIFASEINSNIRTFGWSLSAGMDLDNNEYPDLLVGAYDSNNAVFLKSAPVVHLDSQIQFLVAGKQVDLNNKNCRIRDGTSVPCVDVEVTVEYDGVGVPDTIDLELQYILDAKKDKKKRLFFLKQEGESQRNQSITVIKGRVWRQSFKAHLPASGIDDKLTSIDIQVRYSLADNQNRGSNFYGQQRKVLAPVLGHNDKLATDTMSIQKNCGEDNICVPDLSVEASTSGAFQYGGQDKMEITAEIINNGEDAFNAMLYLQLPREINWNSASSSTPGVSVLCSAPDAMNNRTLECDVGNPFPANTRATIRILLQPRKVAASDEEYPLSEYVFFLAANSSNPERGQDVADNQMYIRVPLSVTADWKVTGKSEPAIVEYNITEPLPEKYKVEDQIGPEVVHIYDVKNKGPATIKEAEVFIMWPSFTKDDQRHLLYLLGVNYDPKDKVTCQPIRNINPLYIKTKESVGYAQALQEVLEMDGEVRKTLYSSSSYSSSNSGGWSSGGSSSRTSYNSGSTKYQTSNTGRTEENQRLGGGSTSFSSGSSSSEINGGNTRYGSVSRVAEGAEETQLIDETATNTNANNRRTQTSSSSTSFGVSSTSTGSGLGATSGWKLLPNGTYIRIYDSRSTSGGSSSYSSGSSSTLGSSSSGSNAGADSNLNTVLGAAQGPGDYRGTMRKTELEKEAGGSVFSSTNQETRNQVENTRFQGNTGSIGGSSSSSNSYYDSSRSTTYGAEYDQENDDDDYDEDYSYSSRSGNGRRYGSGTQYEEGSYFDQEQGQNSGRNSAASSSSSSTYSSSSSSSSSSFGGSEDSSASSASAGRWVWSDATGKWEWSTTTGTASESSKTGTTTSSSDLNSNNNRNNYNEGSEDTGWIMLPNGTQVRTQSSWSSSSYSSGGRTASGGNRRGGSGRPQTESGNEDTGWLQLPNGTMVRRQKSWSRTQYETSYGGVQLNPDDRDELVAQLGLGEVHDNEVEDDKKPWSDLDELQRKVDAKAKAFLDGSAAPSNIEPGFENQYRAKRQLPYGGAFDGELVCDPDSCTMIRCTIGALEPNEGIIFRVRSRLFTQTLVEKYGSSVQISSKLVARITQLPYMADPMSISYQTQQVTTEVFPSEMGEGSIPWWVWLLAAILGLLLLALIVLCLYKCGFFKRKRPESSPEREPLNGYH